MPTARIAVTAVTDEGDNVIVWGRPEHATDDTEPVGFVYQTKGQRAVASLAERASRLTRGTKCVITYVVVADEWNVANDLTIEQTPARP